MLLVGDATPTREEVVFPELLMWKREDERRQPKKEIHHLPLYPPWSIQEVPGKFRTDENLWWTSKYFWGPLALWCGRWSLPPEFSWNKGFKPEQGIALHRKRKLVLNLLGDYYLYFIEKNSRRRQVKQIYLGNKKKEGER